MTWKMQPVDSQLQKRPDDAESAMLFITPQNLGSAQWQDGAEVEQEYRYQTGAIWLGRTPQPFDSKVCVGEALGLDPKDDRHVMLIGGTRAGKGTTSIIPNLCLWPGSLLVIDPKGENASVTAERRGMGSATVKGMEQKTWVLDPFGVARNTERYRARFNPIAQLIDPVTGQPGRFAVEEAAQLAAAIVVDKDTSSADPFWNDAARAMIETLILHVISSDNFIGRRNLSTIRELIVAGDTMIAADIRRRGREPESPYVLLWDSITDNPAFNGVVSRSGEDILNRLLGSEKQFIDVRTNASVHTKFLDSPELADCLSDSNFRLEDLKIDRHGVSVFICLPQWLMQTHYRWMRIITALATTQMEKTPGKPGSGHPVLMVLDEFAGLKRMESIENSAAQYAGAGLKMFFGLQNLDQLRAVYPNGWESLVGLCGIKIAFGIDCNFTAQYLSKAIGNTEVVLNLDSGGTSTTENDGWTKGGSSTQTGSFARGTSDGTSEQTNKGGSTTVTHGTSSGSTTGFSHQTTKGGSDSRTESRGLNSSQTKGSNSGQSQQWRKSFFGGSRVFQPYATESWGNNGSSTTGESKGTSISGGSNWGQSEGTSQSRSEGFSDSRAQGTSWGSSEGKSHTESETETRSRAEGQSWGQSGGRSQGKNSGWSQTRQKRPLIEPDEIVRYFARIMDKDKDKHPDYPGLGIVLITGESPLFMRRTLYYDDKRFKGLFSPHPDHLPPPLPAVQAVAPVNTPVTLPIAAAHVLTVEASGNAATIAAPVVYARRKPSLLEQFWEHQTKISGGIAALLFLIAWHDTWSRFFYDYKPVMVANTFLLGCVAWFVLWFVLSILVPKLSLGTQFFGAVIVACGSLIAFWRLLSWEDEMHYGLRMDHLSFLTYLAIAFLLFVAFANIFKR